MNTVPSLVAEHLFFCAVCSEPAGHYRLFGTPNQGSYKTDILLGEVSYGGFSVATYFNLGTSLLNGDAKSIHKLDQVYIPCYCPECDAIYCNDHWKIHVQYDDDGWRDSIRGMCPKGHKRMLED